MATKKKPNRKPAKKRAKPAPAVKSTKLKKPSKPAKAKARPAKPAARKAAAGKSVKRPAVKRSAVKKAAAKPAVKRAAKAPATMAAAAVGLELPPEVSNLALVLDALHAETGSNGGDAAKDRVQLFRDKRGDVDARTFGFVSSLPIRNWYASAFDRPNEEERKSLWFKVRELMQRPQVPNPGGWDGASPTDDLRLIAQRTAP